MTWLSLRSYRRFNFDASVALFVRQGFIEDPSNVPDIWAHHKMPDLIKGDLTAAPKTTRGAIHQFGMYLGKARAWPKTLMTITKPVFPTRLVYKDQEHVNIAGRLFPDIY